MMSEGKALITAGRVKGTPVVNMAGERIGHVEDLSIDKVSGQVVYALLSFGGFLGIGERFHPLPWSILDYEVEEGGYRVQLDKAQLEAAPTYSKSELEAFGGEDRVYRERLYGYYG
ncbi:MAG: PRC-barrel domain containing protein, partial [Alphaproteobacteria bacterium]